MATNAVTGSGSASSSYQSVSGGVDKVLDRDAFLKLLITELQHQDPMDPMKDKDFIAQLAQFSSLEQMERMNKSFESFGDTFAKSSTATQAYALTGQWVDYVNPFNPETMLTGRVDGVVFENGVPMLKVGTNTIGLDSVLEVYPTLELVGKGTIFAQAISLLEKTVDYVDPAQPDTIQTGTVTGVNHENGWPKLSIGASTVELVNVLRVHTGDDSFGGSDTMVMAEAMRGKWVEYNDRNNPGQTLKGMVKGIDVNSSAPRLKIGDRIVDINDVVRVYKSGS